MQRCFPSVKGKNFSGIDSLPAASRKFAGSKVSGFLKTLGSLLRGLKIEIIIVSLGMSKPQSFVSRMARCAIPRAKCVKALSDSKTIASQYGRLKDEIERESESHDM
jgi:hypothetical protein